MNPESANQQQYSYAYELEAHAIIISQAQRDEKLVTRMTVVGERPRLETEEGLDWIIVDNLKLYAGHCDLERIMLLQKGCCLVEIVAPSINGALFSRQNEVPVAAVLFEEKILYKCPLFDLESYCKKQTQEFF